MSCSHQSAAGSHVFGTSALEGDSVPTARGAHDDAKLRPPGRVRMKWRAVLVRPVIALMGALISVRSASGQDTAQRSSKIRGDTDVVIWRGGGALARSVSPVVIRRIAGVVPSEPFGRIAAIAALPNGGVVVYDQEGATGPVLQLLDSSGAFVREVARQGSGPGEIRGAVRLAVSAGGLIYAFDIGNMRVEKFSANGKYLGSIRVSVVPGEFPVRPGTGDTVYVAARTAAPVIVAGNPRKLAYIKYDGSGHVVDSVFVPLPWLVAPRPNTQYDPTNHLTVLADGSTVQFADDRLGFLKGRSPQGSRALIAEYLAGPVRYGTGERSERQAQLDFVYDAMRGKGHPVPRPIVPEYRPAFDRVEIDPESRIWFVRTVAAKKTDAGSPPHRPAPGSETIPKLNYSPIRVAAAFRSDGSYLGEVSLPDRVDLVSIAGDVMWVVQPGPSDVDVLIEMRIHR